ncbi:hypothetical protein [Spiribacter insolitus]|uniref:Uncharacterized protein n=1 Tax=Spiribacter insolitus TaxID=3122417 RepID=A0ABV3T4K0_9GAMM
MEREIKLAEMSREALNALRAQVDSELEARAFEEQLRRELQSHLKKQAWIDSHHEAQRRRR